MRTYEKKRIVASDMISAIGKINDSPSKINLGPDGVGSSGGIDRRRFVKGAIAGLGVATVGLGLKDQQKAEATAATNSTLDGQLRAITWTGSNSAVGLFSVGSDDVRVRSLTLRGDILEFSGGDIARLTVGPGPGAIGVVPKSAGSILVTKTTLEAISQYIVSFDLDPNVRQFLLEEGIGFDGYKTVGQTTFDIQQVVPEPYLVGINGEVNLVGGSNFGWKKVLTDAHYQPISMHYLKDKWMIFLASSGSSSEEVSALEDLIGVELSPSDASIKSVHAVGSYKGHSRGSVKAIELSESRVAFLSTDDSKMIRVITYDLETKEAKDSVFRTVDLPKTNRILQHDRRISSSRLRSWIAELIPGTYVIETMGDEVL